MLLNQETQLFFRKETHAHKVRIPEGFSLKERALRDLIFPVRAIRVKGRNYLVLAMADPEDLELIDEIEFIAGMNVIPAQASIEDIQWLVHRHYYKLDQIQRGTLVPTNHQTRFLTKVLRTKREMR